jgi:hypothetical protein
MVTAIFSTGGFCRSRTAIYLLRFLNSKGKVVHFYIGQTGSSNGTGISSPFQRLATHLHKRGETHSCILDLLMRRIDKNSLNSLRIEFYSVFVDAGLAKNYENWMLWKVRNERGLLNNKNKIPRQEPNLRSRRPKEFNKLSSKLPIHDC